MKVGEISQSDPAANPQRCPPCVPCTWPGYVASALLRASIEELRCQLQRRNALRWFVTLWSPRIVNWSSKLGVGLLNKKPAVFSPSPLLLLLGAGTRAKSFAICGSTPIALGSAAAKLML